ncbi:MAG TPA: hypothetical protein VHT29_07420 [Solirubrobacteraceae bacterium]|jgi:hypothetical protein|nr:hypothetical protein [Solirubrobacteraceae bacterium]
MRSFRATAAVLVALAAAGLIQGAQATASPAMCRRLGESDVAAKELARTAEVTTETYATDHEGSFSGVSLRVLHRYEPTLAISSRQAQRENASAYLYAATSIEHGEGYVVMTRASDGNTYTIIRRSSGQVLLVAAMQGPTHCSW